MLILQPSLFSPPPLVLFASFFFLSFTSLTTPALALHLPSVPILPTNDSTTSLADSLSTPVCYALPSLRYTVSPQKCASALSWLLEPANQPHRMHTYRGASGKHYFPPQFSLSNPSSFSPVASSSFQDDPSPSKSSPNTNSPPYHPSINPPPPPSTNSNSNHNTTNATNAITITLTLPSPHANPEYTCIFTLAAERPATAVLETNYMKLWARVQDVITFCGKGGHGGGWRGGMGGKARMMVREDMTSGGRWVESGWWVSVKGRKMVGGG